MYSFYTEPLSGDVMGLPSSVGVPVYNVTAYGATGNGTTNDLPAIQAAINAAPDGSTIYFPPGSYRVNGYISIVDRALALVGAGIGQTTILQGASGQVLIATSNPEWIQAASGIATALVTTSTVDSATTQVSQITLTAAKTILQGMAFWVYSSDVIPSSKPSTGGKARRMGEGFIASTPTFDTGPTSTTTLNASGMLYEQSVYTTGIKVAKFATRKLILKDFSVGTVGEPTPGAWNTGNEAYIEVNGYLQPIFESIQGDSLYCTLLRPIGCFMARITNICANTLWNDPPNNRYGYGIDDRSQGTLVIGLRATNCRHGYTTNSSPVLVTSGADGSSFWLYGRTMHCVVADGVGIGCSNSFLDTHDEAAFITFDSSRASVDFRGNSSSATGFGIRGRYITVRNCDSDGCKSGLSIYASFAGSNSNFVVESCRFLNCTLYGVVGQSDTTATTIGDVIFRNVTVTVSPVSPGRAVSGYYLLGAYATWEGVNRVTLGGTLDTNSYAVYCGAGAVSPFPGTDYVLATTSALIIDISGQTATGVATCGPVYVDDGCTFTGYQARGQGLRAIYGAISNGTSVFVGSGGGSKGSVSIRGASTDGSASWIGGVTGTTVGYASDSLTGAASAIVNQTISSPDTLSLGGIQDDSFYLRITLTGTTGQTFVIPNALPTGSFRGQVAYISVVSASSGERIVLQHGGSYKTLLPNAQSLTIGVGQVVKAVFDGTNWAFGNETRQSSNVSTGAATTIGAGDSILLTLTGTSTYAVTLPSATAMPGGVIVYNKTGSSGIVSLTTVNSETINASTQALAVTGVTTGMLWSNGTAWVTVAKGPIVVTYSSNNTVPVNTDMVLVSGTFSLTLPTARLGKTLTIFKTDAATVVTLVGTIDGSTTHTMTAQYTSVTLMGDGTNWNCIGYKAGALPAAI